MIRLFNHYVHRQTLLEVLFDSSLLCVAVLVLLAIQVGASPELVPLAGTHVLSLAAGVLVIGTASGMYQRSGQLTLSQSMARATLMLVLTLPLTYLVVELVPVELPHRLSLQLAAIGGVVAVVLRRVYLTHSGTQTAGRSRILIFGAGAAADVVAKTLADADRNVDIVGFYAGPNEAAPTVPANKLLPASRSLIATAEQLNVDEIVVALTERRAGSMPLRQLLDCKLRGIKV